MSNGPGGLIFATNPSAEYWRVLEKEGVTNTLYSYYYATGVTGIKYARNARYLDSGAFSAQSAGKQVDLDAYIRFVAEHDCWDWYVSLDQIPKAMTFEARKQSARAGWDNLMKMVHAGLSPMPVYHQHEEIKWLLRILTDYDKHPFVGLSPSGRADDDQYRWLDQAFDLIEKVKPDIKTHAFGVANLKLLRRHRWTSADTMKWVTKSALFEILVPFDLDAGGDYTREPETIRIGSKQAPNHISNLDRKRRLEVDQFLKDENLPISVLQDPLGYLDRATLNVRVLQRVFAAIPWAQYSPFAKEKTRL